MRPRLAIIILCVVVLGAAAGVHAATYTETLEFSFAAAPGSTLTVTGVNGAITFEPWDGDRIIVTATKRVDALTQGWARSVAGRIELHVTDEGGRVAVEAVAARGLFLVLRQSVAFAVRVPQGWYGTVELRTSNGAINAREVHGDVVLKTANGSVTVDGHAGRLRVEASNGRVQLRRVDGAVEVHTSNGSVSVEEAQLKGYGRIRTSNGHVHMQAVLPLGSGYEVRTSNGSVTVALREPVDVYLDLSTSNGSVRLDGLTVHAVEASRRELRGTIGSGAATLAVRTSNGSITVSPWR